MHLVIDIGNTKTKVGVFDMEMLVHVESLSMLNTETLLFLKDKYAITHSIMSSVVASNKTLEISIETHFQHLNFDYLTPIPINNLYETPQSLGLDRLACVTGAHFLHPQDHVLIIDAGTCIKFDHIGPEGDYRGGSISPGIQMRFNALHTFTGKLPLIDQWTLLTPVLAGNTTSLSMLSGVLNGVLAETSGIIEQYLQSFPALKILITGGDANFLDKNLKISNFATPNLSLIGLNTILNFNLLKINRL